MEGITANPAAFVAFTPQLAWRLVIAPTSWVAAWGETNATYPDLENPPPAGVTAAGLSWRWTLEQVHTALWPVLCWAAVAGALFGLITRRALVMAISLVPVGYLLSTALAEGFAARYNASVVPFIVCLAFVPLDVVRSRVAREPR